MIRFAPTHRNRKSGGLYMLVARGHDATNRRAMERVAIYVNANGEWFSRWELEFEEKFVALEPER